MEHSQHVSVMLDEVLKALQPFNGGLYIDGTLGGAGHTAAILEQSAPGGRVLGIDTDEQAIQRVQTQFLELVKSGRLTLAHGNFSDLSMLATQNGFQVVQGVLLDLGFSSDQMDNSERGFSFSADGPLDMRLDQSLPVSAEDLVNTAREEELADIFWKYGDERRSRSIAHRIVIERGQQPITRTKQLARIAAAGVPFKAGAIHPATRVFQALRIAVNQELKRLEDVLPQILDLLSEPEGNELSSGIAGGRMAIISFHSLEDRIVKEFMKREASDCICPPRIPVCICGHKARIRILTPKPLTPGEQEISHNPRARSAKLRVAEMLRSTNSEHNA